LRSFLINIFAFTKKKCKRNNPDQKNKSVIPVNGQVANNVITLPNKIETINEIVNTRSNAWRLRRPAGMGETAQPSHQTKTPKVEVPEAPRQPTMPKGAAPPWWVRMALPPLNKSCINKSKTTTNRLMVDLVQQINDQRV
jgi:hypothetical protein